MAGKVVVFEDKAGEFRWHREAGGNVTETQGEGHKNRAYTEDQAKQAAEEGDEVVFRDQDGNETPLD